ncbi:MAG: DUF721 domain-containing protein [Pseudomonadota bacterium]|nr:DUF721 domain-containing protein [Pseudomonadota bacterium]
MKDINQLINHQKLHQLIHHAASLSQIDKVLDAILPPALKGKVHSARLEDRTLSLITPNASFATQVRFSSSALLAAMNEQMPTLQIQTLRCRVKSDVAMQSTAITKIERTISGSAASSIIAAAETMPDERLRAIWLQLGRSAVANDRNRRRKIDR